MKQAIIGVGKIKEKYFIDAINEYLKRLKNYTDIRIIEVDDEKDPHIINDSTINLCKNKEGHRIVDKINSNDYVVCLCIDSKQYTSEDFANVLSKLELTPYKRIVYIIGGSNGLSDEVLKRANFRISFSKLTFPHQLMRVILIEQIYRAHKINSNEPYHK